MLSKLLVCLAIKERSLFTIIFAFLVVVIVCFHPGPYLKLVYLNRLHSDCQVATPIENVALFLCVQQHAFIVFFYDILQFR